MNDMSAPRLEPPVVQVERLFHGWRPEGCDRVALVLQGGGALGAYQAGVDHYWDGGLLSNTPLQHLLDLADRINTQVFQVDLCCSGRRRSDGRTT